MIGEMGIGGLEMIALRARKMRLEIYVASLASDRECFQKGFREREYSMINNIKVFHQ
jgi:hypothetical protein